MLNNKLKLTIIKKYRKNIRHLKFLIKHNVNIDL